MHMTPLFLSIFLFFPLITSALGGRKWQLDKKPAKGVTGVLTNGNVIEVYYGDEVWWHAKHLATEGWGGKQFSFVKSEKEKEDNRKEALRGVPSAKDNGLPNTVRDEKPCAIMEYRTAGKQATVWALPSDESIIEGHLENEALTYQAGGYANAGKFKVKMIDNRAASTPSRSPTPQPLAGKSGKKPKRSIEQLHFIIRRAQEEIEAINIAERDLLVEREMNLAYGLQDLERRNAILGARDAYDQSEYGVFDSSLYARDAFGGGFDDFEVYSEY